MKTFLPITNNQKFFEKLITKYHLWFFKCPICGKISKMINIQDNLRESCLCDYCHSINRQRQIAYIICQIYNIPSLSCITTTDNIDIYNTESYGAIHQTLLFHPRYTFSEFFNSKYKSGQRVKNILHQDLMSPSFEDNQFDLIISSDVFEHIPDPYLAHRQIYRILKPGGHHIFTVPFNTSSFLDEHRTKLKKPPIYHQDGIHPKKGTLVHTIFGIEMLSQLQTIGFQPRLYLLNQPFQGIIGTNAIVFTAQK